MTRVVLVTGSTSGIGLATARRFAEHGDTVVFNSARSAKAGEELARATPGSIYLQANISEPGAGDRLIESVLEQCGRLDVLVNNAGTTKLIPHGDLAAADVGVWREIFEVNVFGTWQVCVAAVPALRESRGAIVNVSSVAGCRPVGSSIPYAASKAALNHLTSLLAKTLGPEVRVNAVAPGLVDTPWTASFDAVRAFVNANAPLRRSGVPDDVVDAIVFLASASYVTGQVVADDGGLTLIT